jgi:outer membrane protein, multidrug efflux system
MRRTLRPLASAASALIAAGLAGCVVGPNYGGPPPVASDGPRFVRAQAQDSPAPPLARWWTALGDPELDRLEDGALAASLNLDVARARLSQSRAALRRARADRLPSTQASALYLRAKEPSNLLGPISGAGEASQAEQGGEGAAQESGSNDSLDFYDVGFDATWELDLFGGKARAIEGAKAGAEAAEADLQDAQVSLTAEVAQAYVRVRDLQQRIALSRLAAAVEADMVARTRLRQTGGTASDLDVERLTEQLRSTQADLVPLQAQLSEQLDRIAVLLGRAPGAVDAELQAPGAVPAPPAVVAVGDPAALLRRRPDIRAAERRLQQRSAAIGERTADLFPKVQLLGNLGFSSTDVASLLEGGSFSYIVAPVLQWSPFDFGRTRSRIRQAEADRDEQLARYRQTVLSALQDADTAISRYGRERDALGAQLRVQASADRAARLTGVRVQGGTATTLDQLDAERRRLQAQVNVAQSRADLSQDYVSLQKSLGLGWSG